MTTTMLWLYAGLLLTTTTTVLMVWYVRKVLLKLYVLQELHSDAFEKINSFREHIEKVHELEMFYGDETLQGMIAHSKGLSEYLEEISESVLFSYEDDEENDDR